MTTHIAKIAGRKLGDDCGVNDDLARKIHDTRGTEYVAIAYLKADERGEKESTSQRTTTLHVVNLELAPDETTADLLRELAAAVNRQRRPAPLDAELDAETVDDVVRRGRAQLACPVCLLGPDDPRVRHAGDPDADGAECAWAECGHPVQFSGEDHCTDPSHSLPAEEPAEVSA